MHVLIPGGAGYIGSHTALELLKAGHDLTIFDNFSNASPEAIRRVEELSGSSITLIEGDILDEAALDRVFATRKIDAVINMASLKAVGESVQQSLRYYWNNIAGTLALLRTMDRHGVKKFIFSSSATVYGDPERLPLDESCRLQATNPYGRTKLMIEEILGDLVVSDPAWHVVILRYFNPVGAHGSGRIGEDPNGTPNNLVPFVSQVAVGLRPEVKVFGNDYDTPDGTGVRDYLHVVDLALGHLAALARLEGKATGTRGSAADKGLEIYNLGTGRGYSVLEVLDAFRKASGRKIPHSVSPRRPGDIASCYTDPSLARDMLGWNATLDLDDMCRDAWKWQEQNPRGYKV